MHQSASQIIPKLQVTTELNLHNGSTGCATRIRCQNKTAAYTLKASDSGTYFTTTGDGAGFTFTLPEAAPIGTHYYIVNGTAQTILIATATADTMVAYGDATADSVSVTDIGVMMFVFWNGTSWFAVSFGDALAGATLTVNT
jgi:hypothetical protein